MAQQDTSAPEAVATEVAAPVTVDRHAAAMAAMEAVQSPKPTAEAEPAKVETKPEEPKEPPKVEEQLSPQMAALARREKRVRDLETSSKATLAAREKELADKLAALGSGEELVSLFASNPKEFASRATAKGLTPAQLKTAIQAMWYSVEGGEAPQDIKLSLAMADQAAKLEKQAKEFEEYKARQEEAIKSERVNAQIEATRQQYAASIDGYLSTPFEGAPLVRAFAEENRANIVQQLFQLGLRHAEANPDATVPNAADLVLQLEAALSEEFAPLKKRGFLVDPKAITPIVQEAPAPSALTNQRAATASKQRAAALTAEERHAEAMKALESAQRRGA